MSDTTYVLDQNLLNFTLEDTHDGWWGWKIKENSFYLSPNYWRAFGYDPSSKNHQASEWQEITHPEDFLKVQQALGKHFETMGKNPYMEEVRFKHVDGHWVTVLCRGKVIQWDDDSNPVHFIGIHTDITYLKNKEAEVELANKKLEKINSELKNAREFQTLILKYNPDLIFVKDDEFKIVLANDAFISVYPEEQREKIIGSTTIENYDEKDAEEFLKKDREAFENGYSESYETIIFPDGKNRILYTQKIHFKDNESQSYILGIARDVTQLKNQEKKLFQSNEELAQFAYRTSHDLKAPLATIKGLVGFIEEDLEGGDLEEVKRNLTKVYGQASKLEKLVVDILDLAKADLMNNGNKEVNVLRLVELIKEDQSKLAHQKNVDIQLDIKSDLAIWSQETRLNQILTNLISNSLKYCDLEKDERYVRITVVKEQKVYISVIDNGLGITIDDQKKLFTMFSRFNIDIAEGSGLGMSIVKKSVEAMGGSILVTSNKNETRFDIELPISSNEEVL